MDYAVMGLDYLSADSNAREQHAGRSSGVTDSARQCDRAYSGRGELPRPEHAATATLEDIRTTWPATIDVATACAVLGISRSHGYELLRREQFPCRVLRAGA